MTSLKKYIKDNPHILENRDRIQGVLSDFLSGDKIIVKRLMKGYDNGIIDVLGEENVDEDTKNIFLYKLIRKEDLIQDVANDIFDKWAIILGKEVIITNQTDRISEKKKGKPKQNTINKSLYNDYKPNNKNQLKKLNEIIKTTDNALLNTNNVDNYNCNSEKRKKITEFYNAYKKTIFYKSDCMGLLMFIMLIGGFALYCVLLLYFLMGDDFARPIYLVTSFTIFRVIFFVSDLEELAKMNTKLSLSIELIWRFISYYISFPLFIMSAFYLIIKTCDLVSTYFIWHYWKNIEIKYIILLFVSYIIYKSHKIYVKEHKTNTVNSLKLQ